LKSHTHLAFTLSHISIAFPIYKLLLRLKSYLVAVKWPHFCLENSSSFAAFDHISAVD